jgi:hypothetical protein
MSRHVMLERHVLALQGLIEEMLEVLSQPGITNGVAD